MKHPDPTLAALTPSASSVSPAPLPAPGQADPGALYRIRHSLAHVLAAAVLHLRPGSRLGFGPPIEDGFYYDFLLSAPLSEQDFAAIESRMRKIIRTPTALTREDLPQAEAFARLESMGEPYKREYASELFREKNLSALSFYRMGDFVDMCEGPHVANTRDLPTGGFKIRALAGAYWRGDSKNAMMTRIYVWAFANAEELDQHVKAFHLAQARDHKKLGKELELFIIDEEWIGKGLPLWLPNGTVIRDELEKLMKELEFQAGYHRVVTPHLAKTKLYYRTGHLPYYQDHLFPFLEVREKTASPEPEGSDEGGDAGDGSSLSTREAYCLRPMNCPHHHRIFASRPRSYRELPLRLAEYGQVYRFEDSGSLSGLLRVRGMCMNDGHIYCTPEQIKREFLSVMEMHRQVYAILGIHAYHLRFSTWDPNDAKGKEKYVQQPEAWAFTEKLLQEAMKESGLAVVEGVGEAAFYGPKIDLQFRTVTGREETASTNQLDFATPERLGLSYVGADNQEHRPYIIHRAPLGTHERFVAFLIEHFGGAFPTWLAPVQVKVLTVSDPFVPYGESVVAVLRQQMIRAELEYSSETLGKKIRRNVGQKIPYLLILGEKEQSEGMVTLRRYGVEQQQTLPLLAFRDQLVQEIQSRALQSSLASA